MTLSDIASIVETFGLPFTFAILAMLVFYRLIDTGIADHNRSGKITEANNDELLRLRLRNTELVDRQFELERKYTECKENLADVRGKYKLLENQNNSAVENFLDDTKDFDRELRVALKKVDEQAKEIRKKDEKIAEQEIIIARLQAPE